MRQRDRKIHRPHRFSRMSKWQWTAKGIKRNLERALDMIDFGVGYSWEVPARLAVFPEYFLQGVTTPGKGEHTSRIS